MKKYAKLVVPLMLSIALGISVYIQYREFINWNNMLLNYGSAAIIALSFGGIFSFFGKSKGSAIIKAIAGSAFAAASVFAVAPLVNNIFFNNTGNQFSITVALAIVVAASAVVLMCYYIQKEFDFTFRIKPMCFSD